MWWCSVTRCYSSFNFRFLSSVQKLLCSSIVIQHRCTPDEILICSFRSQETFIIIFIIITNVDIFVETVILFKRYFFIFDEHSSKEQHFFYRFFFYIYYKCLYFWSIDNYSVYNPWQYLCHNFIVTVLCYWDSLRHNIKQFTAVYESYIFHGGPLAQTSIVWMWHFTLNYHLETSLLS